MKIERILLNTDFSKCAAAAYGPAARKFAGEIDLVHCTDSSAQYSPESPLWGARVLEAIRRAKEGPLRREAALDAFRGIHVEPHLLEGVPAEAIAGSARRRGTDLIVQSSHGRTGWRRFHGWSGIKRAYLGSVAEKVARLAACPVLTVRAAASPSLRAS